MLHEGRRGQLSRHQLSSCSVYVFTSERSRGLAQQQRATGTGASRRGGTGADRETRWVCFDGGKLCHQIRLQVPFGKVRVEDAHQACYLILVDKAVWLLAVPPQAILEVLKSATYAVNRCERDRQT